MKKLRNVLMILMMTVVLAACGSTSGSGTTWQEQYDLGMQYLTDGDYEAAIVAFTAAIEIDAKDIQAYTGLVQAYIGTGDYESAAATAEQGAEILSNSGQEQSGGAEDEFTSTLVTLGELCLEDGRYELAVTVFSLAIEINSELADAYIGRAEAYEALAEAGATGDGQGTAENELETAGDGQGTTGEEADENQKALDDYKAALELIRQGEQGSLTEAELQEKIADLEEQIAMSEETDAGSANAADMKLSGNVMQAYDGKTSLPGNDEILRISIRSVTILDNLDDMPSDAWDISQDGDGSVMAWVIESDDIPDFLTYYSSYSQITDYYDFYIAGDGGVDAPVNSHYLFGGYELARTMDLSCLYTGLVTDMSNMFDVTVEEKNMEGKSYLEYLNIENFDTHNVMDMSWMFSGSWMLQELDISQFDTENVTDMSGMFFFCTSLSNLDVSGFDTENVTNMYAMFADCWSLTALDLSNFNTENVTNMGSMFCDCSDLISLDVSSFHTENVTDMSRMFEYCANLTALDIADFNTANVTDMHWMFCACINLISLDVSHFDTGKCLDMTEMFYSCPNLSVDIGGFDFSNILVSDYNAYLGLTN